MGKRLLVLEAHPVQYHAPVYQAVAAKGIEVIACYGSDFSIAGYKDREFSTSVSWDTDLLSGYESNFLSRSSDSNVMNSDAVSSVGVADQIAKIKAHAILLNGYTSKFDRGAIRAALASGIPILFRAETTDHAIKRSLPRKIIRDFILRRFYNKCHRLLYIGSKSYQHYCRLGVPENKLIASPYCVNAASFSLRESDREALRKDCRLFFKIKENQFLLLYSGKLVLRKGVDLLIPAVRELSKRIDASIVIGFLGDGELRSRLEAEADEHPRVGVRFFGFQNQSKLSRYYHAADAVVLPSRESETWGLVVNESLHHGLPAIVSDNVGCWEDLVHEGVTGSVFQAGSSNALVQSIEKVYRMGTDLERRDVCRRLVEDFSIDRAADGIVRALSEVEK